MRSKTTLSWQFPKNEENVVVVLIKERRKNFYLFTYFVICIRHSSPKTKTDSVSQKTEERMKKSTKNSRSNK